MERMEFERIDPVRIEETESESDSEPPAKRKRGAAKQWTKEQEFETNEQSASYIKEVCFIIFVTRLSVCRSVH